MRQKCDQVIHRVYQDLLWAVMLRAVHVVEHVFVPLRAHVGSPIGVRKDVSITDNMAGVGCAAPRRDHGALLDVWPVGSPEETSISCRLGLCKVQYRSVLIVSRRNKQGWSEYQPRSKPSRNYYCTLVLDSPDSYFVVALWNANCGSAKLLLAMKLRK